ncbi:MAG: hypothetical protein M3Y69_01855 [Verrucomicrobiota bacterium]|nr:hypothetical protein [Verrucomicrobiota bacterium]
MKRTFLCLLVFFATVLGARAAEKRVLHAALALDKDSKPTTKFAPDAPKIYAFYIGDAVKAGDKIRAVWIAEDVGDAAPKGTKIDEATLTAAQDNPSDAFSLSKPTKGWPLGKYKVEFYDNDKLAETLRFTIGDDAAADTADKSDD